MQLSSVLLLLTTTALEVTAQGGGWYVVSETLSCTSTCEPPNCVIFASPSEGDIRNFCKQVTDDCADGELSRGQRGMTYAGGSGILGTANFGSGPAHRNNGCPNNDDCFLSFNWLNLQMRYPSALGFPQPYCKAVSVGINGYYNHARTGSIVLTLPNYLIHARQAEANATEVQE